MARARGPALTLSSSSAAATEAWLAATAEPHAGNCRHCCWSQRRPFLLCRPAGGVALLLLASFCFFLTHPLCLTVKMPRRGSPEDEDEVAPSSAAAAAGQSMPGAARDAVSGTTPRRRSHMAPRARRIPLGTSPAAAETGSLSRSVGRYGAAGGDDDSTDDEPSSGEEEDGERDGESASDSDFTDADTLPTASMASSGGSGLSWFGLPPPQLASSLDWRNRTPVGRREPLPPPPAARVAPPAPPRLYRGKRSRGRRSGPLSTPPVPSPLADAAGTLHAADASALSPARRMERAAQHHVSPPAAALLPRPVSSTGALRPSRGARKSGRKPPLAGEDDDVGRVPPLPAAAAGAYSTGGSDYDGEAAAWQSPMRGGRTGEGDASAMAAAAAAASAGDFAVGGRRKHGGSRRAKARAAAAAAKAAAVASSKKKRTFWQKLGKTTRQWKTLGKAPRELWIIFALKFAQSYSYFSFALVLTLFLSQEHGVSDTAAGWTYGAYGVMSTFFGLIGGWAIDYLGVRLSLVLGAVLGSVARFILAFTGSRRTAMLVLYTLLPMSDACGIPIMTIGVKRFTNSANRTYAFSFFYSMMNLAALTAGPLVDAARSLAGDGVSYSGNILWWHDVDIQLSPLRLVVFSGGLATLLMLTVVFMGIREVEVGEDGELREFVPNRDTPMEQTLGVLQSEAFWRLSLFTFLLVGVRLVFRHMDATMPKYMVRTFGPSAPFGLVYSINPFLIIFLVPIVGLLTRHVDSYTMILVGACISGVSPFWMALGASYWFMILFMFTLSVGEVRWAPLRSPACPACCCC